MSQHAAAFAPVVNRAVEDALRDAEADYEARGILVVRTLEAAGAVSAPEAPLYQAIYTIFRGLPARVPAGVALYVSTRDVAGRGVELAWEVREDGQRGEAGGNPKALLAAGPYGDLVDLALLGLDAICAARADLREADEPPSPPSASVLGRGASHRVRRRYVFVVPGARGDA